MVRFTLDHDLRSATCAALCDVILALLEQALDLLATADRDARLSELGGFLEASLEAQQLWERLARDDQTQRST